MINIRSHLQHNAMTLTHAVAVLLIVCLPLTMSFTASAECLPPPDPGPGVHHPVGADAAMFVYNCDNGLWESPHYTYDPVTGETKVAPADNVYTYNAKTGAFDYTVWVFHAPDATYIPIASSTDTPPAGATLVGLPKPASNSITNTGTGSNNTIDDNGLGGASINGTGTGSNNNISGNGTNNFNGNNATNATVNNTLNATANSGNAMVIGNTTAGGAQSGDAEDISNVVNLLQSSSDAVGGDAVTFVVNIDGDVNGDLLFDPATMGSVQPAGGSLNSNTTINNSTNASINNDIDLSAQSGDASVAKNTTGGDATTGNAKTIANVVNLINSAVTSGKSFIGVININGNLNGDILLPPDLVDQLLAANVPTVNIIADTGTSSNNTINDQGGNNTTNVTNTNNQSITNNVTSDAKTGSASVAGNTTAGGAKTGSAKTSITAFNLTGTNIVGSNSILVFVNVVGKWVGFIVNAPAGTTAAALGGGIVQHSSGNNTTNIDNNSNLSINNDIHSTATSGNADVTGNTHGGSATSGDADNAVNLLNVQNSSLSLSNWFGILFINVFGTWNGSFGVNTSAGNPIAAAAAGQQFFGFIPGSPNPAANTTTTAAPFPATGGGVTNNITNTGTGSNNNILVASKQKTKAPTPALASSHISWILVGGSGFLFVAYLFGERYYETRHFRKTA